MDMFAEKLSQKAISDNPSESDKMSRRDDESDRGVKLFGVTIMKSVSTRNLSYNTQQDQASVGYVTDRFGHNLCKTARRNRGIPWTEEEHRLFLAGLEILGKGDWRGISRSFVRTRTPTQVASHAQKYYLRQRHSITDKRRSSVFDICPNHYIHDAENYRIVLASTTTNSKSRVGGIEEKRLSLSIAPPYSCDHSPFYLRSNGWSMIRL